MLALAKIKTFNGQEGQGFNCDLLFEEKKVASVIDDASGGPIQIQWANGAAMNAVTKLVDAMPLEDLRGDPDWISEKWMKELYPEGTRKLAIEDVIIKLLVEAENAKRLKAALKNRILFIRDGKLMQTTIAKTPEQLVAWLANDAHLKADCVLNHLPFAAALKAYAHPELHTAAKAAAAVAKKPEPKPSPVAPATSEAGDKVPKLPAAAPAQKMTLEDRYKLAAAISGTSVAELKAQLGSSNNGQQAMALIRIINKKKSA